MVPAVLPSGLTKWGSTQPPASLTSWLSLHVKHLQVCVGVAVGAVDAGGARMHQHRLVAEVTLRTDIQTECLF